MRTDYAINPATRRLLRILRLFVLFANKLGDLKAKNAARAALRFWVFFEARAVTRHLRYLFPPLHEGDPAYRETPTARDSSLG